MLYKYIQFSKAMIFELFFFNVTYNKVWKPLLWWILAWSWYSITHDWLIENFTFSNEQMSFFFFTSLLFEGFEMAMLLLFSLFKLFLLETVISDEWEK